MLHNAQKCCTAADAAGSGAVDAASAGGDTTLGGPDRRQAQRARRRALRRALLAALTPADRARLAALRDAPRPTAPFLDGDELAAVYGGGAAVGGGSGGGGAAGRGRPAGAAGQVPLVLGPAPPRATELGDLPPLEDIAARGRLSAALEGLGTPGPGVAEVLAEALRVGLSFALPRCWKRVAYI